MDSFPLKYDKLIFDAIHGYIGLTEQERKLASPLINMCGGRGGEMNTAIISGSIGVGFTIPSDMIKREIPSLLVSGS